MKKHSIIILALAAAASLFSGCGVPKDITYFQDLKGGSVDTVAVAHTIRIQSGDKISIVVNSRDPQLSMLFNLPYITRYLGSQNESSSSGQTGALGYMVNTDGTIDFPVLGRVEVAGLTRCEIADRIKDLLVSGDYIKDPVVSVDYLNLHISVMGEVSRPGRVSIDRDEYTLYDALSACGDLTIEGRRDNVKVIRTVGGQRYTYEVNLCDAASVVKSPVYYLQQNDIVYVEPNDMKARKSTVNGNNLTSVSFWMSVTNLLVTVSYLMIALF